MTRVTLIGILLIGSTAFAQQQATGTAGTTGDVIAHATLMDTGGRTVGQAQLQQTPHGVLVRLELENVTPGVHGLHLHETGRCDGPSFESAGGHFNPDKRQHGFLNPRGPHAGDLPNIEVSASTKLTIEQMIPQVTLERGARSLLDADSSAIVIHAAKDDYRTDPAGEAGDRLACGAIRSASDSAKQDAK